MHNSFFLFFFSHWEDKENYCRYFSPCFSFFLKALFEISDRISERMWYRISKRIWYQIILWSNVSLIIIIDYLNNICIDQGSVLFQIYILNKFLESILYTHKDFFFQISRISYFTESWYWYILLKKNHLLFHLHFCIHFFQISYPITDRLVERATPFIQANCCPKILIRTWDMDLK